MKKRLSPAQRREIARLCANGMPASEVARIMGITARTALKWRKRAGVKAWSLPEAKVLSLLRKGWEQRRIARHLKVSFRRVNLFARKNGFGRSRRVYSQAERMAIINDIIHRTGSAASIAKKHRVSNKLVLELAHGVLNCEKFLPVANPPLQSYFSSTASPFRGTRITRRNFQN